MWSKLNKIIEKAGKIVMPQSAGIIPASHWLFSAAFKKEVLSHEQNIIDDDKKALVAEIDKLSSRIDDFQTRFSSQEHEVRELSCRVLLGELESLAAKFKLASGVKIPQHFQPFQFHGIDDDFNPSDFSFLLSKTTPPYLMLEKEHDHRFEIGCDGFFVIAVLNCPIHGSLDIINVEGETFASTSIEDKEVFEAIHELHDIYSDRFKLGVLQVVDRKNIDIKEDCDSFIINDYQTEERLIEYCSSLNNPKTLNITIVAELENLISRKRNIAKIFKKIPFQELKELGIDDFRIDILSCKTAEIVDQIEEAMLIHSTLHDIKITCPVYGGYVQNNSTYCYMSAGDRDKVIKEIEANGQGCRVSADGYKFRNENTKEKKDSLVELCFPGFSICDIFFEEELKTVIVPKNIATVRTSHHSSNPDSDSSLEGEETKILKRVEKKFIAPGAEIRTGTFSEISCDNRNLSAAMNPSESSKLSSRSQSPLIPDS